MVHICEDAQFFRLRDLVSLRLELCSDIIILFNTTCIMLCNCVGQNKVLISSISKVIVRYSLFAYALVRKAKNQIKRRIKETSTILKIIQLKL